jgi:nucleotide-binding universal stress UspA family protein
MVAVQNRPKTTKVRVLHVIKFRETPLASTPTLSEEQEKELRKVRVSLAGMAKKLNAEGFAVDAIVLDDPIRQKDLRDARELLEQAAKKLKAAGFKVDTSVKAGDAPRQIIRAASEWHADLIVVGSQGLTGLKRIMIGSVSDFVARKARCSVQIVRLPVNHKK